MVWLDGRQMAGGHGHGSPGNMNLYSTYSSEDTAIIIHFTEPYGSLDTINIEISNILDWSGNGTDSKELIYTTYLLADYDNDFQIDVLDLNAFKTALTNQDFAYELGPITGTVPHFIPTPNNKFDLRDIMAFVQMWYWSNSYLPLIAGSMPEIGSRIEESVSAYFASINKNDPTSNFQWEYILVDNDKIKNAWCMPGGKIAVYTGILEVTKNKHGLAAVMGHEIAHAVAKHSIERASRNVATNVVLQVTDILSGGKLSTVNRTTGMNTVGLLTQMGILNPFSRKQESEADYLGLIFSSLSL